MAPVDGGIDSYIRGLVKHAPPDFTIRLLGVTHTPRIHTIGKWHNIQMEGRRVEFFAVTRAQAGWLPNSLRYTMALLLRPPGRNSSLNLVHKLEIMPGIRAPENTVIFQHITTNDFLYQPTHSRWRNLRWAYRWFEKIAIQRATQLVCVTRAESETLKTRYPEIAHAIHWHPTWLDSDTFSSTPRTSTTIGQAMRQRTDVQKTNEPCVLVYCGRLTAQKNLIELLATVRQLNRQRIQVRLIIIGDGDDRNRLESYCSRFGLRNVHLAGWLNPRDIADLYASADCFLLPSHYEGMPIALLEAQACGLPAIAYNVGEVAEVLSSPELGVLVEQGASREFQLAVERFVSQQGMYSRDRCAELATRFSDTKLVPQLYDLLLGKYATKVSAV